MAEGEARKQVLRTVEEAKKDLIELCLGLGNARDYPGEEREVGELVVGWFSDAGIEAYLQHMSATSVNAIGVLRGAGDRAGGGRSLILNAHMDSQGSVPSGGEEVERQLRGAWVEGDLIYGFGLANDKAQLAAEMIAMRAIHVAGCRLKEALYVTGVGQETSAPLTEGDEITRWSGDGPRTSQVREGHGARWLVENGVVADYALVGEITNFSLSLGQAGYLRIRVSVPGHVLYTPLLRRGAALEDNPNPFERAAHVIVALEGWAKEYEETNVLDFGRGTIVPQAQVHEVRAGGLPYTETTDYCHVFLDVRTVPGANPAALLGEVRGVVDRLGLGCTTTAYDYRQGFLAENADPVIEALDAAHREVFATDLSYTESRMLSTWRDTNAFNEARIPAICYGARTVAADMGGGIAGEMRPMAVDDLEALAKVYALTALGVCGVGAPH